MMFGITMLVGLDVSVLQVVTQVQEMSPVLAARGISTLSACCSCSRS